MSQQRINEILQMAAECHTLGRLVEAESLYRKILAEAPERGDVVHRLGLIAYQLGRRDVAVELIEKAVALRPGDWEAQNNLATLLAGQGRWDAAITSYRRAIQHKPELAEIHYNLATALRERGDPKGAISSLQRAIKLKPEFAEAHNNLGNVLADCGRMKEAATAYRKAISLRADYAEAHSNLSDLCRREGDLQEAIALCGTAIQLSPRNPEAHVNLGNALREVGKLDEAVAAYNRAIQLAPSCAQSHCNLGNALADLGRFDDAIASYRIAVRLAPKLALAHTNLSDALRKTGELDEAAAASRAAIELDANSAEAFSNLGNTLLEQGKFDEAIAAYVGAIRLRPDLAEPHRNLGVALQRQGQLDEAIAEYETAIKLKPTDHATYSNLGNALKDQGRLEEAIAAYRKAAEGMPEDASALSGVIMTMGYLHGAEPAQIAVEARRWDERYAKGMSRFVRRHSNDCVPSRRLRIGYVSPDFRNHVVGRNIFPLVTHHDKSGFEITCYANLAHSDTMTRQFQEHADRWRNIWGVTDDDAARQIQDDKIDILIDLALHTANNRLQVFGRKPAPAQVSFAGYPGTTGLSAMNYRLSDPFLDPADVDESVYSEKTFRLSRSFWCYDPLECQDLPVSPLPALANGFVTFGSLNNFCKVNRAVLTVWAQVLLRVPASRLLLLAHNGDHRRRTKEILESQGVDPDRVQFISPCARVDYMSLYSQIDIGLDTFPYNGHTTSLDSFWMGVPVVTLVGKIALGRAGWSQLSNLGLTELAGSTTADYAEIAVELAADRFRLIDLRKTLRTRMTNSPLMDSNGFARDVEAAYRQIWRAWCISHRS